MSEIVFEVGQEADGGFTAEAIGESIFTQADSWDELRVNVREAVRAYYFDSVSPASIRLRLVRDEVLEVASSCRANLAARTWGSTSPWFEQREQRFHPGLHHRPAARENDSLKPNGAAQGSQTTTKSTRSSG